MKRGPTLVPRPAPSGRVLDDGQCVLTGDPASSDWHVGRLSIKRGIAPLSTILSDTSEAVTRAYAANALGRIREGAAIEALVTSAKVRRYDPEAGGHRSRPVDRETVVPHLLMLREDKSLLSQKSRPGGRAVGAEVGAASRSKTESRKVRGQDEVTEEEEVACRGALTLRFHRLLDWARAAAGRGCASSHVHRRWTKAECT
jgi:hypothetical protein